MSEDDVGEEELVHRGEKKNWFVWVEGKGGAAFGEMVGETVREALDAKRRNPDQRMFR